MPDDGFTGPLRASKEQLETWYHRMKDFMNVLQSRQMGVACHPSREPVIRDMLERLIEDDTWPHDEVPPLVTSITVKPEEIRPVDLETMKTIHLQQVTNSRRGFGRFGGLLVPKGKGEGLHDPWREAALLASRRKEQPKLITPDVEDPTSEGSVMDQDED